MLTSLGYYSAEGGIPQPSPEVERIESATANSLALNKSADHVYFPERPGFGTLGQKVPLVVRSQRTRMFAFTKMWKTLCSTFKVILRREMNVVTSLLGIVLSMCQFFWMWNCKTLRPKQLVSRHNGYVQYHACHTCASDLQERSNSSTMSIMQR